jgi:hypothetical protein
MPSLFFPRGCALPSTKPAKYGGRFPLLQVEYHY